MSHFIQLLIVLNFTVLKRVLILSFFFQAYRNFGSRVKNLKRRLDDLIPTLKEISPIPSPDVNAPSPSPDSDIELPGENDNTG
jgi:hypothetical protein